MTLRVPNLQYHNLMKFKQVIVALTDERSNTIKYNRTSGGSLIIFPTVVLLYYEQHLCQRRTLKPHIVLRYKKFPN